MEAMDIIKPAFSEWRYPVTLVLKKDGTLQFCIDFQKVNAVTLKDTFPLPTVDDCIKAIVDCEVLQQKLPACVFSGKCH